MMKRTLSEKYLSTFSQRGGRLGEDKTKQEVLRDGEEII